METSRILAAVLAGLSGAAVGSFLNVVVHRVPLGLSIVRPPSACPSCETPIRPRDNVPVVSYLLLRGRCRHCGARISPRYAAVELLAAALFAGSFLRTGDLEEAAFVAAASGVFVALAFIDLEHRRVPNVIVLPAGAAAVVWVGGAAFVGREPRVLLEALASGAAGFVLLLAIALAAPGGMGMGDVKLAAFIGLVCGRFGWEALVLAIFAGFIAGGVVGLLLLALGRAGRKTAIPFAPMLCAGGVLGLFAQTAPVRAWLGL